MPIDNVNPSISTAITELRGSTTEETGETSKTGKVGSTPPKTSLTTERVPDSGTPPRGASHEPPDLPTPEPLGSSAFDEAREKLGPTSFDSGEYMKLMVKTASDMRFKSSQAAYRESMNAADSRVAQAEHDKSAADARLAAAIVGGVAKIGAGVAQGIGASGRLGSAGTAPEKVLEQSMARGGALEKGISGLGEIGGAIGNHVASGRDFDSKKESANEKRIEAMTEVFRSATQAENDLVNKAIQNFQAQNDADAQMRMKIFR